MLGRHPTLWIAAVNAMLMFGATLGLRWLDNDQAGLIVVAINAVAAGANAWAVRPIQPALYTYALSSIVSVIAAYGLHVTADQLAGLNTVMISVLGFLTYGNVSPIDTAISRATIAQGKPEVQTVPEG